MRKQLLEVFPEVKQNGCLDHSNQLTIGIVDDEPCRFTYTEEEPHLVVENPKMDAINLLKIDNCLLTSKDEGRCDCAVFNEEKLFFVEIKKVRKPRQRTTAKDEAIVQLRKSINYFKDRGFDFQMLDLKAIICCTFRQTHQARTSSKLDAVVEFQDELNALLLEGNSISF